MSTGSQTWPTLKEVGATLPPAKAAVPQVQPRTLTGAGSTSPHLPASPSTPVFFQCPVCRSTLMIRNPDKYDGTPGPCTNCHAIITAPAAVKAT